MKTEDFSEEMMDLGGNKIRVTSYKIDNTYYCHISNADPGATIARASAVNREVAIEQALKKTRERLKIPAE